MSKPQYRVTMSRKDGADIEFTNYKGETVEKKYAPLGALFPRDKGEGFSFAIDPASVGHTLDPETFFYNVYPVDNDNGGDRRGAQRPQRKPAGKPGNKGKGDGDLEF